MNETYTTVVGTVITAPSRRHFDDGTTVVNFRVASNERRFDRASQQWSDGETLYVSVTCWRRLAENLHASLATGDPVVVHGRLYTRGYERDGRRISVTELEATAAGPDLTRCTAALTRTKRSAGAGGPAAVEGPARDGANAEAASGDELVGATSGLG